MKKVPGHMIAVLGSTVDSIEVGDYGMETFGGEEKRREDSFRCFLSFASVCGVTLLFVCGRRDTS